MAEKRSQEESAQYDRRSSTKGLAGRYFERSKPRSRGCAGENVKTSPRAKTRGGERSVYTGDTASLERFQAQPIWEMSAQGTASEWLPIPQGDTMCKAERSLFYPSRGTGRDIFFPRARRWKKERRTRSVASGAWIGSGLMPGRKSGPAFSSAVRAK